MIDGKPVEQTRLFNTTKAKKISDVKNSFNKKVQEIYITDKGIIFLHNINKGTLEIADQKQIKKWIGENEPEKYIKFFGEVEEG
jgi:hypothetical protein